MRKPRGGLLAKWWPAVVIVALALLSVQMLRSSYLRWQGVLEETVSAVHNVDESRRRLLRAYLVESHQAMGDPTFVGGSALAEVTASADALNNWFTGRSTLGGFEAAPPSDQGVIALGRSYQRALAAFRDALGDRSAGAVERRQAFSAAQQAGRALEAAVHMEVQASVRRERTNYRVRLFAWGGILLVAGLGLIYALNAQRRAEDARDISESRLSRLRALAPVGIVECEPDGRVRAANTTWTTLTGRAEREWLGRRWWEALAPADQEHARALWERSVPAGSDHSAELRIGDSDSGDELWVLARSAPERGPSAEAGRWVVTLTDVTARRQAEAQLQHAQRMEAVGRLAGGVAHDFNNLLTSLGGFATLARDAVPPGSAESEDLAEIQRGVERGRALTRQLLTFSRQDRIRPEPLDLRTVVLELERMLRRLVREDIELSIRTSEGGATILADRGQIEQVITNLVINAADAMPEGGRIRLATGTVRVEEAFAGAKDDVPPGRYVLLSVSDTGSGIPPEIQGRIFEPFFTTKEQGKGTGLGLSTVWAIVRQSGGHVHLYSEPGRGTVFKIYMPALDLEPAAAPAAGEPAVANAERDGPAGTILIVEDQESVRRLAVRILELRGFTVLSAADGAQALKILDQASGPIDLVITDVVMRGMSGLELVERIRARGHETPALFMSGYSDAELPLGGAAFLEKPFSPDDLVRKVRQVLA